VRGRSVIGGKQVDGDLIVTDAGPNQPHRRGEVAVVLHLAVGDHARRRSGDADRLEPTCCIAL